MKINKRYWSALVMVLVALDVALTYWQNSQLPLDGDLVPIVFPAPWYSKVMHDPFGWAVLTNNEVYAATNRFFAHATMTLYWRQVPHLLQHFVAPISSLYAASALFNTGVQTLILLILAAYVRLGASAERAQSSTWSFWLAVGLLTPLFQTNGFYEQMGITNWAVTYTFFYALPIALLLILLWPFYRAACRQQTLRLRPGQAMLLLLLMVVIAFNGPIATAAVAVLLLGIGIYWVRRYGLAVRHWPLRFALASDDWLSPQALGLLAVLGALSVYSLYIGRNNAENSSAHSLWELYQLLPIGIYLSLKMHWGLPLLIALLVVNYQLVRRLLPPSPERQRALNSLRWAGLFALVFLLLLPLGGYRPYRPYLVRGDSVLPIIVGLFYAYGVSTHLLLNQLGGRALGFYAGAVALFAMPFVYADSALTMPRDNGCERWALDQIARSLEPIVHVAPYCSVISWDAVMPDYHQTDLQGQMLYYWGVTTSPKLYYQK